MTQRSIPISILLSVVTCGIYGLYWFVCLTDDSSQMSGDRDITGGMALLFTIITCGIYGIYWCYRTGTKLNEAKRMRGMMDDSSLPILYIVLAIFGLQIVVWALMQNDLNKMLLGNGRQI